MAFKRSSSGFSILDEVKDLNLEFKSFSLISKFEFISTVTKIVFFSYDRAEA